MDDATTSRRRTTATDHHAAAGADAHAVDGTAASSRGTTSELHGRLLERSGSAAARDAQAQARDGLEDQLAGDAHVSSVRDVIVGAALDRERASEDRALAAEQGAQAARDRAHVRRDRLPSMRDRAAAVTEQQLNHTGDAGGVLSNTTGVVALRREVDRAYRTESALTVVYVDVDAGDEGRTGDCDAIVRDVAARLIAGVRSYDLVIAVGADAFVCALCDATISAALERFGALEQTLAQSGIRVAVGYAELAASDTPDTLIDTAAADAPTTTPGLPTRPSANGASGVRVVLANANGGRPR